MTILPLPSPSSALLSVLLLLVMPVVVALGLVGFALHQPEVVVAVVVAVAEAVFVAGVVMFVALGLLALDLVTIPVCPVYHWVSSSQQLRLNCTLRVRLALFVRVSLWVHLRSVAEDRLQGFVRR